jgi:hypothetical protein
MNYAIRTVAVLGVFILYAETNSFAQVQTYCTNIAGNIACTSYGGDGSSSQSYCTSIAGNLSCTTYNNDNDSRVQVEHNYETGQVIGSALGNLIAAAIQKHRAKKQARQDWDQVVQDAIASVELACETNPGMSGPGGAVGCRTACFAINSFIHKHRKDFLPNKRNMDLLGDAIEKTPGIPDDMSLTTEEMIERAFQSVDKKQMDNGK